MVTLISGFFASNRLTRSVMTSPSLPSEYQVMRNCVCANADGAIDSSGTDMAATKTPIDISLRTLIISSQIAGPATMFLLNSWVHHRVGRGDNQYAGKQ